MAIVDETCQKWDTVKCITDKRVEINILTCTKILADETSVRDLLFNELRVNGRIRWKSIQKITISFKYYFLIIVYKN